MRAATAVCVLGSVVSTVALRTPADANLNSRAAASLEEFKSAVEQMRDSNISTTALFNLSTSDCALTRYSHWTTELHVEPEDEQIFLGGLPCSDEHCHMHNPDEMIPICHKIGGCCLSAASWDAERHTSTVAAAACNATDVAQRWSAIGGQVCLKHFRQCLHYDGNGSVVLTPFAEDGTHPEQQWHVSASSIEYRGAANVCLAAEAH